MRKKVCLILVVCFVIALAGSVTLAEPHSIPGGPWTQPEQTRMLESLSQPEDVEKELLAIERRSMGRMEVELIGHSAGYEWPIYVAKFGEPCEDKARILIDTQIHGGEPLGTEAALGMIQQLAMSNNPEIRMILDNVTVWIIPMLNMDGATFFERDDDWLRGQAQSRQNIQHWTPEEWGLDPDTPDPWYRSAWTVRDLEITGKYDGIGGYDMNRDAHPHLDFDLSKHDEHGHIPSGWGGEPGFYVCPEIRALRDVFKKLEPDLYVNHHHRGSALVDEEDRELMTLQILGKFVPLEFEFELYQDGEHHVYYLDEDSLKLSKQVNALVYQKLDAMGDSPFTHVTKFPLVHEWSDGRGLPGTTLGSFSMNDSAVMLYEVRGFHIGQQSSGMLTRQSYIGLYETLLGFATGEVYEIDPAFYDDEIPPAGPSIGRPERGVEGF